MTSFINKTTFPGSCQVQCQLCELSKTLLFQAEITLRLKIADVLCSFTAHLLFPLIRSFPRSHNLEYDSSEEKNPRLIFYNEKDEVVKVSCEFRDLLLIRLAIGAYLGSARTSRRIHVGKF